MTARYKCPWQVAGLLATMDGSRAILRRMCPWQNRSMSSAKQGASAVRLRASAFFACVPRQSDTRFAMLRFVEGDSGAAIIQPSLHKAVARLMLWLSVGKMPTELDKVVGWSGECSGRRAERPMLKGTDR